MVSPFDLARKRVELEELKADLEKPEVWQDLEKSKKINQSIRGIEHTLEEYDGIAGKLDDAAVLVELGMEAGDESLDEEVRNELAAIEDALEKLRLKTLLRGKYDGMNAILTLHAGAGGTEACDWASMLYRMYQKYCEKQGFSTRELDLLEGDEAGIKSVTFEVEGENAYGYLKAEKGVHRLVRISPFDADRKSTRLNSSHEIPSRMPSSA